MRFISLLAGFAALGVAAGAAPANLESAIAACAAETAPEARLACYDKLAAALKPVAAPAPEAEFGAEAVKAPPTAEAVAAQDIEEIQAVVKEVSRGPTGRFIITLDNGQVWRQVEGDKKPCRGKPGDKVEISRGFLGSYNLSFEGTNIQYKVVRVS